MPREFGGSDEEPAGVLLNVLALITIAITAGMMFTIAYIAHDTGDYFTAIVASCGGTLIAAVPLGIPIFTAFK